MRHRVLQESVTALDEGVIDSSFWKYFNVANREACDDVLCGHIKLLECSGDLVPVIIAKSLG